MTVGIDTRPLFFTRGGITRYVSGILNALPQIPDLQIVAYSPKAIPASAGIAQHANLTAHIIRLPLRWSILERIWENILLPLASRSQTQLMHYPRFAVPKIQSHPTVVTIHDLTFMHYPETMTKEARHYFETATDDAVRRANAIITVSKSTRDDLLQRHPACSDRVYVVPNGIDNHFSPHATPNEETYLKGHYHLQKGYLLYVGTLEPRKNIEGILKAYRYLLEKGIALPHLVLAGGKGWLYTSIFEMLETAPLQSYVHVLNYVPEADLPALYRQASVFLYPSFYEGFGLPILEAMACGTPVITSKTGALAEVGENAALYVDPHYPEALADMILRLLEHPDQAVELRQKGLNQAAKFSWSTTAYKTFEVYQHVI